MTADISRPIRRTPWALALALLAAVGCDEPRPAAPSEAPPPPEGEVTLTPEQVTATGVEVAAVGSGVVTSRLVLTAVVQANQDEEAHVTPKVPGIVRAIHTRLGDTVQAGDAMCELESVELGEAAGAYLEAAASLDAARETARQTGELLERGVEISRKIFERERDLKEHELGTLRPYYDAEKALSEAELARDQRRLELASLVRQGEIHLAAARTRLRALGLEDAEIATLQGRTDTSRHSLRAPRAGIIASRHITQNEFVGTDTTLFQILDLSRVWVLASVYEDDLRRVRSGQAATVLLKAFPGAPLEGRVTFLDYRVDDQTRACAVRIELENRSLPDWPEAYPIRPGMFATVELRTAERGAAVVVPADAVLQEEGGAYVFVARGDEVGHFTRRDVVVGQADEQVVEITRGLAPGERVAVKGAFTLKSAAQRSQMAED